MLASSLFLIACTTHNQDFGAKIDAGIGNSREALIDSFRAKGNLLYIYGSGDSAAAQDYRKLLTQITGQSRRTKAIIRSDKEVTDAELHDFPLFLLGKPSNNAVLRRLLPQMPFNVTEKTVAFNQQQFGDHPVLGIGFYPNPLAPGLPLSLMTGIDEQDIISHIKKRFAGQYFWFALSSWGYEMYDGGQRKIMGFFDESDPKQWKIGGKTHWDFTHDGKHFLDFMGFSFFAHQGEYPEALADSIGNDLSLAHTAIANILGKKLLSSLVAVHLYPSIELKGLATGDTRSASMGLDSSLHIVVHPEFAGRPNPETNIFLIRKLFPTSQIPALELGLAIWPSDNWERAGWQYWAKMLAKSGNSLTIQEMLTREIWEHESSYLKGCMSAALVDFFYTKFGQASFLRLYQTDAVKAGTELLTYEKQFQAHLLQFPNRPSPWDSITITAKPSLPTFHKAFNFAHEGYQIFNGYASKEAIASMQYLNESLHCNTVAVIPYAGYADVQKPTWLEFSDGPGAENDESIVHCLWSAKQAGMQTMLKPQVWPWNSWTGEIAMQNEGDWTIFFDHYYRWIRHYAIMAEFYGADILCIGVEFSKATLQRPDDWRKMIDKLRKFYHGKITYAANWGDEFEQCKFWDALDFVGINCYYPLTKKDNPTQKELDQGFAEILDKVERVAKSANKDVLFTEIGFRAVERTWQNPHAEPDDRKTDDAAQESCYRAMIKGLEGRSWCRGVYLWKWPAYMDDAKYDLRGFTPLGRRSEELVRNWFGEH